MDTVSWVAALSLFLVVTSSVAQLETRLEESSNSVVITARRDGEEVEVARTTVEDATGSRKLCSDPESEEDCIPSLKPKITSHRQGEDSYCVTISVSTDNNGVMLSTCINHTGAHIYGGPEQYNQTWPVEDDVYSDYAYVSKQEGNVGVAERYWLFSDGRYVYVPPYVPLFIEQNTDRSGKQLCFFAKNWPPYPVNGTRNTLEHTLCQYDNARLAHEKAIKDHLGKPSGIPDERMTTHPIWSTWARYKRDIDETTVRQFASEILAHGFDNSQIEIDDKWETCYGSLEFDPAKFPDAGALVADLHEQGFRVTLWVHPFVNSDCEPHYSTALASGLLVAGADGGTNTSWWNGQGGIVDFNHGEAAGRWTCRLWKLKMETGIDSFKFDAGETSWLPPQAVLTPLDRSPVQYSVDYVRTAAQFGPLVEVRIGQHSQQFPYYIRMIDKDSRWGLDNGLASLVTTLLQMNIAGYPFVLPDMVGGNGYGTDVLTKELFIRWLQATVFMPAIQFSYVPWDFDDETVELSRQLTALHARYAPRIIQLMRRAASGGSPVNPPIWWVDPTDETALTINSEFLLGEDILVAPVLEEGAVSRDIYLPRGNWTDEADPEHPVYQGPAWLYNYSAPLDTLPYFSSVSGVADLPASGGAPHARLFTPATAPTGLASTLLLYICSISLRHLLT